MVTTFPETLRPETETIVGVFDNRADAQRALNELRLAGFRDEQIGFAVRPDGLGLPREKAEIYAREFSAGRTLLTIHAGERYDEAANILQRYGGYSDPHLVTPY